MYYNPGGTIQKIIQTKQGVLPAASETAKKTKKKNNSKYNNNYHKYQFLNNDQNFFILRCAFELPVFFK